MLRPACALGGEQDDRQSVGSASTPGGRAPQPPTNPSPHPAKDPGLPPRAGVRFLWNEIDRDTAGQLEQENSVLAARLCKLETPRELAEK